MKVKANELQDAPLAWAVAKALQLKIDDTDTNLMFYEGEPFMPDTYWQQGGPIVEQNKIDVMWCGDRWCAYTMTTDGQSQLITEGDTPLLAAMRGFVAANLGDEVDVPDGLALDALIYETTTYEDQ